jgi:hypothetical protein
MFGTAGLEPCVRASLKGQSIRDGCGASLARTHAPQVRGTHLTPARTPHTSVRPSMRTSMRPPMHTSMRPPMRTSMRPSLRTRRLAVGAGLGLPPRIVPQPRRGPPVHVGRLRGGQPGPELHGAAEEGAFNKFGFWRYRVLADQGGGLRLAWGRLQGGQPGPPRKVRGRAGIGDECLGIGAAWSAWG